MVTIRTRTRACDNDLGNMALETVPPEIAALTTVRVLDLSGNQIASLPMTIGDLEALHELWPVNNPLAFPPPHISEGDTEGVLA